jgi:hypothetical protein
MCSALLRHEARVQRLEKRVDVRDREDAQAQVDNPPLCQVSKPHKLTPRSPPPRPLCIVF